MCEKEKVSVIITTFGIPEKLERAINSVLNQTYKNIELIVVDDNNPTSEGRIAVESIMKKYTCQKTDMEIKYIKHAQNMNGSAARNTGIKNSTGKYIAFLDDDDIYLPDRIEFSVEKMDENKDLIGICVGVAHSYGKKIIGISQMSANTILSAKMILLDQMSIGTGSNIFLKRRIVLDVGGFDINFARFQDLEFMIRVSRLGKVLFAEKILIVKDGTTVRAPKYAIQRDAFELFDKKFKKEIDELSVDETEQYLTNRLLILYFSAISGSDKNNIINAGMNLRATKNTSLKSKISVLPPSVLKIIYKINNLKVRIMKNIFLPIKYKKILGRQQYDYIVSLL